MKKLYFFLFFMIIPVVCNAAAWNSYTNLTAEQIAEDDEFGIWDTSAGGFRNVTEAEMYRYLFKRKYQKVTSGTETLDSADLGKTITNAGATGNVTITLPECVEATEGWNVKFVLIETSYTIAVDSHTNDTLLPIVDTAGDSIISPTTLGSVVYVECLDMGSAAYDWYAWDDGFWTDNN